MITPQMPSTHSTLIKHWIGRVEDDRLSTHYLIKDQRKNETLSHIFSYCITYVHLFFTSHCTGTGCLNVDAGFKSPNRCPKLSWACSWRNFDTSRHVKPNRP